MKYFYEIDTSVGTYNVEESLFTGKIKRSIVNAVQLVKPEWRDMLRPHCVGIPRLITLRRKSTKKT